MSAASIIVAVLVWSMSLVCLFMRVLMSAMLAVNRVTAVIRV